MAKTRKFGKRRNLVKKHKSRRKAKGKAYEKAVSVLLSKKLNDVHLATYGREFFDPGNPSLVSKIASQLHDTSDTICEICLRSMLIDSPFVVTLDIKSPFVVTLDCSHTFHAKCLRNQIKSGDTACFICRMPMTDEKIKLILAKRRIRAEKQEKRREEREERWRKEREAYWYGTPIKPPLAQTAILPRILIDEIVNGTARDGTPEHLLISIVDYLRQIELLEDELRQYTLQIQKEPPRPQIPNISLKQALADEERMDIIVEKMRKFRAEAHYYYNFINTNASANDYIAKFKIEAHDYLSRINEKVIIMKDKTDELLQLALNNKLAAQQIVMRIRVAMQPRDITRNIM
jgi:hypothetical protein